MKPLSLFPFLCLLGLLSATVPNNKENTSRITIRSPQSSFVNAWTFDPTPVAPRTVMIRRNINSLSNADIASIRAGVAAMKALPVTNPTSWDYQAAIHGTILTNALPSWNSCEHFNDFFLAWHRMYLYFFERILRAKSGNPNLTLPYWNYQITPTLHLAYRSNTAGNVLFDGTRAPSINAGAALPVAPMTTIANSLSSTGNLTYFQINNALESPHGSIHGAIGGNMGFFESAAKDPCFWLHHANIDRLWEEWLRKCGGRSNPSSASNAAWMNKSYTFFDENGAAVSMTLSQMLTTASSLNYRYDFSTSSPCDIVAVNSFKWNYKKIELFQIPNIGPVVSGKQIAFAKGNNTESFNKSVKDNNVQQLRFRADGKSDQLILELDGVAVDQQPEGVIEVYLNLPLNERATPRSKSFVGVLDLFTARGLKAHGHHQEGLPINVTQVVRQLGLKVNDLPKARVTFITRGNVLNGKEVKTVGKIRASTARFVINRVQS